MNRKRWREKTNGIWTRGNVFANSVCSREFSPFFALIWFSFQHEWNTAREGDRGREWRKKHHLTNIHTDAVDWISDTNEYLMVNTREKQKGQKVIKSIDEAGKSLILFAGSFTPTDFSVIRQENKKNAFRLNKNLNKQKQSNASAYLIRLALYFRWPIVYSNELVRVCCLFFSFSVAHLKCTNQSNK